MKLRYFFLLLIGFSAIGFPGYADQNTQYDIVIKNGIVIDGSGRQGFHADVGIISDRIAKIGIIEESSAQRVINAVNMIVAPGFIDVHTHCDRGIVFDPKVENYIRQGVTTVIGGNCGGHPYPLRKLFKAIEDKGTFPNFGSLVGHNTIRQRVMKFKMEAPTPEELENMKMLIHEEMRSGGLGFSTGLAYLPGIYSDEKELTELASAVAPYGGIYTTHLREQGEKITEAIEEAIRIGEKNRLTVLISHVKLIEDLVWGQIHRITDPVEAARKKGSRVFLDQYPYTAASTGFTSSFPAWAFEGGRENFLERLNDSKIYSEIKNHILQKRLVSSQGIDKLESMVIAFYPQHPDYQGKSLRDILILQDRETTPENGAELIIEIEKSGGASAVFFLMDESDVESLMKLPYTMHASDGGIQRYGEGVPHPRNYGTFPRVFDRYVRQRKVISLEEAVFKMTSLPASVFKISDRGILKPGFYADIVVFDPETFRDQATYQNPHQYSTGLATVLVNGIPVVENNRHTGALPGKIIYGGGRPQGDDL